MPTPLKECLITFGYTLLFAAISGATIFYSLQAATPYIK